VVYSGFGIRSMTGNKAGIFFGESRFSPKYTPAREFRVCPVTILEGFILRRNWPCTRADGSSQKTAGSSCVVASRVLSSIIHLQALTYTEFGPIDPKGGISTREIPEIVSRWEYAPQGIGVERG